jgi:uncharacterized UPF0146 family protein
MILSDAEKAMCKELGLNVTEMGIESQQKTAKDMEYAGFGVYISDVNRVFEKVGETLEEVITPELEAEKRFLAAHRKQGA